MDKRIGAQFFTIREHMKTIEDFECSCKKIHDIGYQLVQISGTSLEAAQMRPVLDKYGLQVVTTHRRFEDFMNNLDEVIEYNRILGSNLCGVGCMPEGYGMSQEKVTEFIGQLNGVCEQLKKKDMYFGYHNHALEFVKYQGKTIFDRLVEETDPEVCCFIADTYWAQAGGANPVKFIEKLGKRAMAVHFKDFSVRAEDWTIPRMCEVGKGNLDWDKIIIACEEAGCRWALVEQDTNHMNENPFLSLETSYAYLKTKGFY